MLTMRRVLGGVVAALLVSGVAGAQTATAPTESAETAALRVKANSGDANAQSYLGYAYDRGEGVPQDYAQAALWYRKAAEQGDARAQYNLGVMYANGQGVSQDFAEAYKWFNLAASLAQEQFKKEYANMRDAAAKRMTPQQLADAQKVAREWLAAFEMRGGKK